MSEEKTESGIKIWALVASLALAWLGGDITGWVSGGLRSSGGSGGYDKTVREDIARMSVRQDAFDSASRSQWNHINSLESEFDKHLRGSGRSGYQPPIGAPVGAKAK